MVGGTGLYIKAFCEGLDLIPEISTGIREAISKSYNEMGFEWLKSELATKDPLFNKSGEMQNPQRMMRALEVMEATGKSILSYHSKEKKKRDFNIIKTAIDIPREKLLANINQRVDQMIEQGLVEEVRSLLPVRHLNALQTVGYTEIFDYLDNKITLPQAIERIKINTRQYAKRQLTWFKKDSGIQWLPPEEIPKIKF